MKINLKKLAKIFIKILEILEIAKKDRDEKQKEKK